MPLFTKTIVAGIAALLSIPVFGAPIIAANYSSPILNHLIDIVNGPSTQTVASLNAPNWSVGVPLAQPAGLSTSYGKAGSLASSTTYYFEVAALDGYGTTTVSANVSTTTDYNANNSVQLSWGAVPGAAGYAVYFSTTTAANFSRYFLASSTNGVPNARFTFSTSTGSLAGTNTLTDSTAFSLKFNPLGRSSLQSGLSIGTSSPLATIDVASGTIRAIGASTSTCNAANAGAIQFQSNSKHFYGCLPSGTWQQLDN